MRTKQHITLSVSHLVYDTMRDIKAGHKGKGFGPNWSRMFEDMILDFARNRGTLFKVKVCGRCARPNFQNRNDCAYCGFLNFKTLEVAPLPK